MSYNPLYTFSVEELDKLKLSDLKLLADYHSLEYDNKAKKSDIIKLFFPDDTYYVDGDPTKPRFSARVRRIKEQNP